MHKKRAGKRGFELSLWVLIETLIAAVVIVIVFQFITGVRDDTLFEQRYMARDIALLMDSVSSVPGDVYYTYESRGLSDYDYIFSGNTIRVTKPGEEIGGSYVFYYDNSHALDMGAVESPNMLYFSRSGESLRVAEDIFERVDTEKACPDVETRIDGLIILDVENPEHAGIAKKPIQHLITTTGEGAAPDRLAQIPEDASIAIAIREDAEQGSWTVYVSKNNYLKSSKFACLLEREIEARGHDVVIIPSDEQVINKNTQGIGVKMVLPSDTKPEELSSVLLESLRGYHG